MAFICTTYFYFFTCGPWTSQEEGLEVPPQPDIVDPQPTTGVNLTWAAHDLHSISEKDGISPADIEAAAGIVNQALQVSALQEPICYMLVIILPYSLILLKQDRCKYRA